MTDKQALARWRLRHDFMESLLVNVLVILGGMSKEKALGFIQERCEKALKDAGFKYPFTEDEK